MATVEATATIKQQILSYLKTNMVRLVVTTGNPANYADIVNIDIATVIIDSTDFTGPQANGNNQEVIIAAQSGLTVDTAGTSDAVVMHDNVAEYMVLEADNQSISLGNTVNLSTFTITQNQPT